MPRLLWLMFQVPMSSPQMTRMFGGRPDGAALRLRRLARCRGAHRRCRRHRGAGEKNVAAAETFF